MGGRAAFHGIRDQIHHGLPRGRGAWERRATGVRRCLVTLNQKLLVEFCIFLSTALDLPTAIGVEFTDVLLGALQSQSDWEVWGVSGHVALDAYYCMRL